MDSSDSLVLGNDERYRCSACGNVTRFDVVAVSRTRRFHHYDLSGDGRIEEEDVLEHRIESVTCRWCGRDDAVSREQRPDAAVAGGPERDGAAPSADQR